MSSCPRVSGRARSSSSIRLPHGCRVESPARCQPLAQTLRPDIGPVLFDVVQTRSAVRFAVNHPPAGWNVGEGRPQAVLLLVVAKDEKAAIFVVERIDAHRFSRPSSRNEFPSRPYWRPTGSVRGFGKVPGELIRTTTDAAQDRKSVV